MTLKGCTKAELLWLIDWMCTHSMFWHDIEIERALNALELEREQKKLDEADRLNEESARLRQHVPFPVSWTVKMKKKQKETQDILSYHSQAAGCSDKARAKASGGRQPIEECGRTGL